MEEGEVADLNANFEKDGLQDLKDLNSNHFWTIDEEKIDEDSLIEIVKETEFVNSESSIDALLVSMETAADSDDGSDSADSEETVKEKEPLLENSLRWEEYFGSSVDLAPALLDIYDSYNVPDNDTNTSPQARSTPLQKDVRQSSTRRSPVERKMNEQKKRPLSISSLSSSSSSTTSLHRPTPKKLAVAAVSSNSDCSPTSSPNRNDVTDGDLATDDELNSDLQTLAEEDSILSNGTSLSLNGSRSTLNGGTSISTPLNGSRSTLNSTLSPLNDAHRPLSRSGSDECRSVLDRVVEEIMVTERLYVTDMLDIIQGYLDHIVDQPTLIMSTSEIEHLFGNIREIYAFNRELLARLEDCGADPVKISQCFVDHNDGFIIYTQYCTNYPSSMETLTRCMRQSDLADLFKQRQLVLRQPLPLGSYLLKPVQRILKYHLLMQNMLDNSTSFTGESARVIRQAFDGMTRIANHINEMKRKHEHAVRIQEIQSLLSQWDGEDLTTYGELLMEDTFRLGGAKSYRHLFLFNKALLISKKRDDGVYTCKCSIMCSNLMLIESIQNEPLSFHVIPFDNPKLQVTLQAKNVDHKRKWCHEIKRLIMENYNAVIPEKARNLVMNLGAHHDTVDNENVDLTKRHAAPEYLDRRRTRRKSAGFIPDLNSLMRSQRGRKSNRKSEVFISSPKSSPPMSRKFSLGDIGRINMAEMMQTSMEFDRSRRGQLGPRPRPRSRSFDCGETLDIRRLSESSDSIILSRHDDKRTSLPRDQRLETPTSRLSELSKRYSFKIATKLNRIDSTTVREKKRRSKKNGSVESMDVDSDTEGEYINYKKNVRNGASDPYLSLEFLRRAKDVILRRRPDEQRETSGRCQEAVSADDTADTDSISSSFSDAKSTGSNTSLLPGAYDNITFGRAFDAQMRRLADSDDDVISADENKKITVNRSNSFNGPNGVKTNRFYGRYSMERPMSPLRTLSSPAPERGTNHALMARSVSAENSPLRLPGSRTTGSISSVESLSSTPRSNHEICWTDLEEYIANDSDTLKRRLPKFPVMGIDLEQELEPLSEMSASTDCLNGTLKPKRGETRRSSPLRRKNYDQETGSESEEEAEKESELERRKKHVYELTRAYSVKMKLEKSREIARELCDASPVLMKTEPKRSPRFRKQNREIIVGGVSQPVSRQTSKETSPERHHEPLSDSESQGIDTGEEFIRGLESLVASESSMNTSMAESTADSIEPSTDGGETPGEPGDPDLTNKGLNIKDTIRRLERRGNDNNAFKLTLTKKGKGSIVTERVRSLERCTTSPRTIRKYSDFYRDKYNMLEKDNKPRNDENRSRDRHVTRCRSESDVLDRADVDVAIGYTENAEVAENLRGYVKHVITQFQQESK